jgi:hypothetical protein
LFFGYFRSLGTRSPSPLSGFYLCSSAEGDGEQFHLRMESTALRWILSWAQV